MFILRLFTVIKRLIVIFLALLLITAGTLVSRAAIVPTLPYIELVRPDRGRVFAVTWSPHGQYVAVGTDSGLWIYTNTLADVTHIADEPVHALAWSPDGKTLATGYFGNEGPIQDTIFTASDGFEPESPNNYLNPNTYLDPVTIPTSMVLGGGLRLWSVSQYNGHLTFTPHPKLFADGSVYALKFDPSDDTLAILSQDHLTYADYTYGNDTLHIYDIRANTMRYTFWMRQTEAVQRNNVTQGANGLSWTHDGRYLAIERGFGVDDESNGTIWDSRNNRFSRIEQVRGGIGPTTVFALGWNQDNSQLATSTIAIHIPLADSRIQVCDYLDSSTCDLPNSHATLNDVINTLYGGEFDNVQTLAWQPNGHWLAYDDGTSIRIYDSSTQQNVAVLDAARESIAMLEWSPDGSKLLSSGMDYAVRIWTRFNNYTEADPTPITDKFISTVYDSQVDEQIVSPNGKWILLTDPVAGVVKVIDANDGAVKVTFGVTPLYGKTEDLGYRANALPPFPDSLTNYFYWTSQSELLVPSGTHYVVWSIEKGQMIRTANIEPSFASYNAFNALYTFTDYSTSHWRPDGTAYADIHTDDTGSSFGFTLTDVHTGKIIQQTPLFTPGDLQAMGADPQLRLDNHHIYVGQWSPDGRMVAFNDSLHGGVFDPVYIMIWDTKTNAVPLVLILPRTADNGSGGDGQVVGWSPDGSLIAVQGYDVFYVYRLHWEGNKLLSTLVLQRSHGDFFPNYTNQVQFSPDSRYLFFSGTVYDMATTFPVIRFRNSNYDSVYWEGNTLRFFQTIPLDSYSNRLVTHVTTFNTSDFLPKS